MIELRQAEMIVEEEIMQGDAIKVETSTMGVLLTRKAMEVALVS